MPNRYLGRDLANQRYLGRDVSSIRSFGRIVYEATPDNALDLFRVGVAAVDVFVADQWQTADGAGTTIATIQLLRDADQLSVNADGTTPLADITGWIGASETATGSAGMFLNDRTPIGSFVLLWTDDENFGLYQVDSHLFDIDRLDIVSLEMMVSVGTTGTLGTTGAGGTLYVFTDTALFLRSVERNLFSDLWQPRAVLADPFVPILATITYNATTSRYEALATGGTGTLNYAWTFEVDGSRFRLDPVVAAGDATYAAPNALTNAQRMTFGIAPGNIDTAVDTFRPAYNPTTLFPGHTVSNIGLTMSDDTHDEFFPIADTSNITVAPTGNFHWIFLSNWRNASGLLADSVSVSGTPIGTTVANWAFGHTDALVLLDASFDGLPAEYEPYSINGTGHSASIFPVTTRLGTITLAEAPSLTMNAIALFRFFFAGIGNVHGGNDTIDVAIPQTS